MSEELEYKEAQDFQKSELVVTLGRYRQLERELAAVTAERDALQKTTLRLMDEIIATEKERDALMKDKERLDWLELASADEDGHMVKVARFSNGKTDMVAQGKAYHSFLSLRTAIDAALAELKGVTW